MASTSKQITQMFIDAIENGFVNGKWVRPWDIVGGIIPTNAVTEKPYRGLNALMLMMVGGGWFAGYGQWQKIGGQVRKGEKGIIITIPCFKKIEEKGKEIQALVGFKFGKIFAVSQQDGWIPPSVETINNREFVHLDIAELFIEATGADITHGNDKAAYIPSMDHIIMPKREQFHSVEDYYATILHELVHWTGAKTRCDRLESKSKRGYAYEELVAELGASFLCAELGIHQGYRDDHAKYIKGWLKEMGNDNNYIIEAAKEAQLAVDYLKHSKVQLPQD